MPYKTVSDQGLQVLSFSQHCLTLSHLQAKTDTFANSVDLDEMTHNQDLLLLSFDCHSYFQQWGWPMSNMVGSTSESKG